MPNIRLFWVASFLSLLLTACGGGSTLESGSSTTEGANGSISLSLSSPDSEDGVNASKTSPITVTATVKNKKGSPANLLVSFILSNDVGELSPSVGTAVTNSSGQATLFINPSEVSGAGSITANVSIDSEALSSNPVGYSFSGGNDSTASLSIDAKLYTCDETWSGTASGLDGCTRTTQVLADGQSKLIVKLTHNGQGVSDRLVSIGTENAETASSDLGEKLTDTSGVAIFTVYPSSTVEESLNNVDFFINVNNETLETLVLDIRPINLFTSSSIFRCPSDWIKSNGIQNCTATTHIIAGEPKKYVFATQVGEYRTEKVISGYSVTILSSLIDLEDSHLLTDSNGLAFIELKHEPISAEDSITIFFEGADGGTQVLGYTATVLTDGSGGVVNDDLKLILELSSSSLTTSSNIIAKATLSNGTQDEIEGKVITFSLDETSLGSFSGNSKAVTDSDGIAELEFSTNELNGSGLLSAAFGEASDSKAFTVTGATSEPLKPVLALVLKGTEISESSPGILSITLTNPNPDHTTVNQLISLSTTVGGFQDGITSVLTGPGGRATAVIEAGDVKNAGTVTASYPGADDVSINFSSRGDQVATSSSEFKLSIRLLQGLNDAGVISDGNSATAEVTLIDNDTSDGVNEVENKVVTFLTTLGTVFPETALTNENGVATIEVTAGETKGAGLLTASVLGETAVIGFTTEGDENPQAEPVNVSLALYDCTATNADALENLGACSLNNNISLTKPGTLLVTVTRDNSSDPVEDRIVTLSTDTGVFSPANGRVLTNSDGLAAITLLAGDGQGAGTITATTFASPSETLNFQIGAAKIAMGVGSEGTFVEGSIGNDLSGAALAAGSTTLLTVNLVDKNNTNALYTSPVDVTFSSKCASETPAKASIDTLVRAINGIAQATYRADGCQGADSITATATAGSLSLNATGTVTVADVAATSIEFVEIRIGDGTDARIITYPGTGNTEKADVKYRVLDANNNPASGETVYFKLSTAVGGVTISPTEAKTDSNGLVTVSVQSGTVPTPVSVLAQLMKADGSWNAAEVFTDTNANGVYDSGENFTDTNGNERWDDAEAFTDANGNDSYDGAEAFVDANNNESWDVGETFTDSNGNGSYDVAESFVDAINAFHNPRIQSVSDKLTVSTGLADQNSFSLSTSVFNPEGWNIDNMTTSLTILMGDRSNNLVPDDTAVQFVAEGGVIEPSCATVDGQCSVTWRSSDPRPLGNNLDSTSAVCDVNGDNAEATGSDFAPANKPCVLNGIPYALAQPRAGRATVLAYSIGIEAFTDTISNGVYDAGEAFGDLDEAFLDINKDRKFCGKFADGSDAPGAETADCQLGGDKDEFIDFNSNESFDQGNGIYNGIFCTTEGEANGDCTKELVNIRNSSVVVMSGSFARFYWNDAATNTETDTFNVDFNDNTTPSSATVEVFITDENNNPMPAGTTVQFTTSNGKLSGTTSFEFANTTSMIPQSFSVTVSDDTPTGVNEVSSGLLQVLVETPNGHQTIGSVTIED